MLSRRDFLRRGSIALAGGLLVGDAALEAFERLTHRKVFALGEQKKWRGRGVYLQVAQDKPFASLLEGVYEAIPEGAYEDVPASSWAHPSGAHLYVRLPV